MLQVVYYVLKNQTPYPEEIIDVYNAVDLRISEGFRDYCLLHLLCDSGALETEVATLNLDYFDAHHQTLAILGTRWTN